MGERVKTNLNSTTLLQLSNWLNKQRNKEKDLGKEGSKIYFAVKTYLSKAEQALNEARSIETESCVIEPNYAPMVLGQEELVIENKGRNNYWYKLAKIIIP